MSSLRASSSALRASPVIRAICAALFSTATLPSDDPPFPAFPQASPSTAPRRRAAVLARAGVPSAPPVLPYRVGHGWDLHRLEEGNNPDTGKPYELWIGGVKLEHTRGCVAHSDGDVLLHTVTDALLGALCLPDIGQQFPDTDPRWKGQSSDVFVAAALDLCKERGYRVANIDCTVVAERPKLSPHKETIRNNLCALLECHPSCVNLKAKTHEKVDAVGEQRAISAEAVVLLMRDDGSSEGAGGGGGGGGGGTGGRRAEV